MTYFKRVSVFLLGISCVFLSCRNTSSPIADTESNDRPIEYIAEIKSTSKDSTALIQLVKEWNAIYQTQDADHFYDLYAEEVLLYGTPVDLDACINNKRSFFKKHPDSYQQIYGNIDIGNIGEFATCSFIKRVTVNGKTNDYPSYLTFEKYGDQWKIVVESDLVTDKNLANQNSKIPQDAVQGDFNGDGKLEYAWAVFPETKKQENGCFGECIVHIHFSDPNISTISVEGISAFPDNLGDLNNDGRDELGFQPGWFHGCWRLYHVKTWKNNQWTDLVEPISVHCNLWEEGYFPVRKDPSNPNHVIITYSHQSDDIVTRRKSIQIN